MRILVIGNSGQVARSLREAAALREDIVLDSSSQPEVDVLEPSSIEARLARFRPDVVINPAAYTAVDRAETEPGKAFAINRDGARSVAAAAANLGLPIIHLSTDYVFDGTKETPYAEGDAVNPQSVYGRSKLEGERAVMQVNPRHIVLRTSWVYAPFGSNFVRTMLRLAGERSRLSVVDDQFGCPTYAPDIADAILAIAVKVAGGQTAYAGVTHLAGPDALTWCGFARSIFQGVAERGGRSIAVDPITTADYPTLAVRPANSRLSTDRLASLFGVTLPAMKNSLAKCLDRLMLAGEE
ncbi:MAG: dTDP-4-dehydrorhamnose reductase [Xanthobacteraceae bacterium]|nr:dTDP-4-dehydrorhamnose reductase [Xanthobacteraceae bacterium]